MNTPLVCENTYFNFVGIIVSDFSDFLSEVEGPLLINRDGTIFEDNSE